MKTIKKPSTIFLISLFLILPITVFAAKDQLEQTVQVAKDQIIEGNFIKLGNIIDIAGSVNGDVIVAGNSITISGPVAGDVIVAGNNIKISGPVSGSVRVVGSNITIDNEVGKNVWILGASAVLGQEAKVGWDLYGAAGSFEIKGPVGRDVLVNTGILVIASEIGKNVTAFIDKEGQVVLYAEAKIKGDLTYRAAKESQLVLKEGAKVEGKVSRENLKGFAAVEKNQWQKAFGGFYLFLKTVSLFSLLVIGLVILTFLPKFVLKVEAEMTKRPWPSLGWGFVYLVVVPVITIFLALTIIGFPLALIIVPLYLISLYVSKIFAGFAIGLGLFNKLAKEKYKGHLFWPLAVGLVILILITSIPIFGWLVKLLLVLWALGAVLQVKKEILKEYR